MVEVLGPFTSDEHTGVEGIKAEVEVREQHLRGIGEDYAAQERCTE